MLIYFTASVSAKEKFLPNYLKIIAALQKQGHQVISDHIIEATEDKIRMYPRDERLKFHEKVEKWIHSADCLIAETSFPSTSIGYEVALALRVGKPVLILFSEGDPPSLLGQHKDEKLIAEKYTDHSLNEILKNFIGYVEGKHDLRFTFFITPPLISYLDEVSKKNKLPKSVYIRRLIEKDMEENPL